MSGTGDGPAVAPTQGSGLHRPAPTSSDSGSAMAKSSTLLRDRGDYEEVAQIGNGKDVLLQIVTMSCVYVMSQHHQFGWLKQTCIWSGVNGLSSRRMRWAGHVARMGDDRGVHRVLVGKPEGKSPLVRPRRRWGDNIKMDLQVVGGGRVEWMELAQDRYRFRALVGTVRNFRVPYMRGIF